KLANDLAAACAEKPLSQTDRSRLLKDLSAVLNTPGMPADQTKAIADDVQAIFQVNGLSHTSAAAIGNDVKTVAAEVQKSPTKKTRSSSGRSPLSLRERVGVRGNATFDNSARFATVPNSQAKPMKNPTNHLATFGGGCFWCLEAVFQMEPGVKSVTSGY